MIHYSVKIIKNECDEKFMKISSLRDAKVFNNVIFAIDNLSIEDIATELQLALNVINEI